MAGKYEQFRAQMRDLGCEKIDTLDDTQIDLFLLSFAVTIADLGVAIRNVIVEASAFATAIGAFDNEDGSGGENGDELLHKS